MAPLSEEHIFIINNLNHIRSSTIVRFVQLEDCFLVSNEKHANAFGQHRIDVGLQERCVRPQMRDHQKYQLLGGTQILQIVDLLQRRKRETGSQ